LIIPEAVFWEEKMVYSPVNQMVMGLMPWVDLWIKQHVSREEAPVKLMLGVAERRLILARNQTSEIVYTILTGVKENVNVGLTALVQIRFRAGFIFV
jgi:hypothetical protein